MHNSIIVTVFLRGAIGGCVKSVDKQVHSVLVNHGVVLTKEIIHTNRVPSDCVRQFNVDGDLISKWVTGDCPYWENPRDWKKMNSNRRLISYVKGFDEGYGVTFEAIEDGDTN